MGDALNRAADASPALPSRFTETAPQGTGIYRTITDTETGRSSEVMLTCLGTVRRVLSELFPDQP